MLCCDSVCREEKRIRTLTLSLCLGFAQIWIKNYYKDFRKGEKLAILNAVSLLQPTLANEIKLLFLQASHNLKNSSVLPTIKSVIPSTVDEMSLAVNLQPPLSLPWEFLAQRSLSQTYSTFLRSPNNRHSCYFTLWKVEMAYRLFSTREPLSIAVELTKIEAQLFQSITAREFLDQAWQKEDKLFRSPNLTKVIERFNQVQSKQTTFDKYSLVFIRFILLILLVWLLLSRNSAGELLGGYRDSHSTFCRKASSNDNQIYTPGHRLPEASQLQWSYRNTVCPQQ